MVIDGRPELVHVRTRRAVRELMSDTVLRDIDGMWQDEGFAPGAEDPDVGGQRVSRFQSYLDQVDWTDHLHVARALRVFETALTDFDEQHLAGVRRALERDGYTLAEGRITGGPIAMTVREGSLSAVEDPGAIREHLDRISRALADDDPAQAIGSAKELIESTAKLVLRTRGQQVSDRDDFPELVRAAQTALEVHPKQATPGPDGSDAVKRILGGTTAAALGVNELRRRGFGTGHGDAGRRPGLGPRHAHLAVSSAKLWCEFMLDTLADPAAPWRKHTEGEAAS
ncbi:MAG TPA: abortive infection family protein [Jatrophihabitans sp.]|uniref:abortive infection family protein n=1 Tax=Jatrophihabitans sp. TaxID=1932789 RepID=UPI002F13B571